MEAISWETFILSASHLPCVLFKAQKWAVLNLVWFGISMCSILKGLEWAGCQFSGLTCGRSLLTQWLQVTFTVSERKAATSINQSPSKQLISNRQVYNGYCTSLSQVTQQTCWPAKSEQCSWHGSSSKTLLQAAFQCLLSNYYVPAKYLCLLNSQTRD